MYLLSPFFASVFKSSTHMDIMEQQETVQLGSLPSLQITMGELALKGVKQEIRTTVRNVIYLLYAVKHPERMCVSWSVTNTRTGYEVVGLRVLVPPKILRSSRRSWTS